MVLSTPFARRLRTEDVGQGSWSDEHRLVLRASLDLPESVGVWAASGAGPCLVRLPSVHLHSK